MGQPELVAIDRDRVGFDGLGQGGKSGGQARLKRPEIGFCMGRQIEIADKALPVALPELQRDQPVLGRPI